MDEKRTPLAYAVCKRHLVNIANRRLDARNVRKLWKEARGDRTVYTTDNRYDDEGRAIQPNYL